MIATTRTDQPVAAATPQGVPPGEAPSAGTAVTA